MLNVGSAKINVSLKECDTDWGAGMKCFLSMPGLKGLNMAIIGFVNN